MIQKTLCIALLGIAIIYLLRRARGSAKSNEGKGGGCGNCGGVGR